MTPLASGCKLYALQYISWSLSAFTTFNMYVLLVEDCRFMDPIYQSIVGVGLLTPVSHMKVAVSPSLTVTNFIGSVLPCLSVTVDTGTEMSIA